MEINMKEAGQMINMMAKELLLGMMEKNMRVNGKVEKNMEKVNTFMQMEIFMLEHGKKI